MISSHLWYSTFNFISFLVLKKFCGLVERRKRSKVLSGSCLKLFCFLFRFWFDSFILQKFTGENTDCKCCFTAFNCVLNIRENFMVFQFRLHIILEWKKGENVDCLCLSFLCFIFLLLIKVKEEGRNKTGGVEIEAVFVCYTKHAINIDKGFLV